MYDESSSDESASVPLWLVWIGVISIIAAFFWCCAASAYAYDIEGQRMNGIRNPRAFGTKALIFALSNGLMQLPNLTAVVSHSFRQQIWIPMAFLATEGLAVAGYFVVLLVDKNLNPKTPRKKKSKMHKIATPKPIRYDD